MFIPVHHPPHSDRPVRHLGLALLAVAGVIGVVLFAGVSAMVGSYTSNLTRTFDSTDKIAVEKVFPEEQVRPVPTVTSAQNILLMGSDTRGGIADDIDDVTGTRSDTMMVVHVPANRESIQVMSIMRDSWVDIPGYGKAKMNAALAYGGVPLAVQTIEGLIGSRIDRVAIIDFAGFKGITDALGGVEVDNPIAFPSYHMRGKVFEEGTQTLNGAEALAFVRERYAFIDGDYQRVRNQQIFIKGMLRELLSPETLTNPGTMENLVSSMAPYLTLDAGFTSAYAAGLGFALRDIRMENVHFFTMPSTGTGMEGSQSVVYVDWSQLATIQQGFRDDTLSTYQVQAAG